MTFSIAARCDKTGQFGIAISSSSIAVGARCPWLQAGVGAVSSQNVTLPRLGSLALQRLEQGMSSQGALDSALREDAFSAYRQLIAIDRQGSTALFSGDQSLGVYHGVQGHACVAAGNMLADKSVVEAMTSAFENASGLLAERLMAALQAALERGGEAGAVHSAALKVVGEHSWPIVDLRVDWAQQDPIGELAALWRAYQPQMQDYITRAIDPREAPSYGVPGDE
ncbi:DUF1028 domain-containing protein [Serratia rhizosphaerae]|uniref:DUF1028 domain-containing protein n=1 Tax=Serratia rhizosphaerae TaxID=2597702 RepID=A0ABX6GKI5_9GAMM|nr:DUF1028 domain-containing protein [Serratia rhizosphaerae]QHA86774.1 DUF1028 domain-containing protein [Serratia rhizosphaerae]